jgi:hypothetical protein
MAGRGRVACPRRISSQRKAAGQATLSDLILSQVEANNDESMPGILRRKKRSCRFATQRIELSSAL